MSPRAPRKSPRDPQLGDPAHTSSPDTGTKRNLKHPESSEKDSRPPRPEIDRPGQGDDEADRHNQADGHHDTATDGHGAGDRMTKSGRLSVGEIKKALEKADKPPR